jgi:hypothetical protein
MEALRARIKSLFIVIKGQFDFAKIAKFAKMERFVGVVTKNRRKKPPFHVINKKVCIFAQYKPSHYPVLGGNAIYKVYPGAGDQRERGGRDKEE